MLYLTLRQYEYITAIARYGSLSEAADALHVSQPALSTALTRIEDHLDQQLFHRRRGSPLTLTPQGRRFAERAAALLDQAEKLETPGAAETAQRHIIFGCFTDLAPFFLAPALQALRVARPDLSFEFRSGSFESLIHDLIEGRIDMALTYDLGLDANFQRFELTRIVPHALMPPEHALATRGDVALSELARHPLILSHEGLSVQHMLGLFRGIGAKPRIAHRAASLELLRSLAANGEGIGVSYSLPPSGCSYDGQPLSAVPISDPDAPEAVILASHVSPTQNVDLDQIAGILADTLNTPAPARRSS